MRALVKTVIAVFVGFLILQTAAVDGQTALTNDAIIKMVKAGLAEDVILNMINTQPSQFSVTPDAMIALKKEGVSDKVIGAMVSKGQPGGPALPAASAPLRNAHFDISVY